jgi:DNA-binding CsgD family transcriptional regulator
MFGEVEPADVARQRAAIAAGKARARHVWERRRLDLARGASNPHAPVRPVTAPPLAKVPEPKVEAPPVAPDAAAPSKRGRRSPAQRARNTENARRLRGYAARHSATHPLGLSRSEDQLYRALLTRAMSTAELTAHLGYSAGWVKNHLQRLRRKLAAHGMGVRSRHAIVAEGADAP